MKSVFLCLGGLSIAKELHYCSLPHSQQVYDQANDYFLEVFRGFQVPVDPVSCPLHPERLEESRLFFDLSNYKHRKKLSGAQTECPLCNKQFKSDDFFEFHLATQHMQREGNAVCLADLCDIIPCNDKPRAKPSDRLSIEKDVLKKRVLNSRMSRGESMISHTDA